MVETFIKMEKIPMQNYGIRKQRDTSYSMTQRLLKKLGEGRVVEYWKRHGMYKSAELLSIEMQEYVSPYTMRHLSNIKNWKAKGGVIVHLTAYGENIQTSDVLNRIKGSKGDILLIVGSQKVPKIFYTDKVSNFNVSIGNQPHSECSALAIFLDRFFEGNELSLSFQKAKIKIVPQKRGKKTRV